MILRMEIILLVMFYDRRNIISYAKNIRFTKNDFLTILDVIKLRIKKNVFMVPAIEKITSIIRNA